MYNIKIEIVCKEVRKVALVQDRVQWLDLVVNGVDPSCCTTRKLAV